MSIKKEKRAVTILSAIMSIRMLGLFMMLPVFSAYAVRMQNATPTLIGLTLGVYGLTQALFQIPMGLLSDHIGRKRVIFAGLCLLLIGSFICAYSHSIYTLLFGRALQGAGAIGSTVLALVSDLTRDESRSKAMAFLGLSIGSAFVLAMIAGPLINHWFHLSGIFFATALFAVIGLFSLLLIPTPPKPIVANNTTEKKFSLALHNTQLLRLDGGILCLHAILTALFIAIPILLTHELHLSSFHQIILYLSVLVLSFACAIPFIIIAETKRKMKSIFISAITSILLIQVGLYFYHHNLIITAVLLFIFFTAFTLLEATLPSLVSKISPIQNKGAAMGVYSSSQFLGIFIGGGLGGLVFSHAQLSGVFALCAAIALTWFCVAIFMDQPPYLSTLVFSVQNEKNNYDALLQLPGVTEVAHVVREQLLYVKVDKQQISEAQIKQMITS